MLYCKHEIDIFTYEKNSLVFFYTNVEANCSFHLNISLLSPDKNDSSFFFYFKGGGKL